jgi:Arc/MetJ family transcription regulator
VVRKAYNLDMVKRTSLNLDMSMVDEAREVLGTNGTTQTVHKALAEVVRHDKLRQLAAWEFSMSNEEIEASEAEELAEPPPDGP